MSSTILKSAKKTSYGQQVANRQRSENIYFPDALGSKRGEYGRVRAVVAQLSGGESEFWVADESAPHPAKTAPYGDPALRSTRISAPSRWALSFGEAPRCGWWWSWQIRMPLSHAPSKQEPPWFGPSFFGQSTFGQSTTRNMVGTSDELSIPSDITGKSASLWPTATASLGLLPGS